MKAVITGASGFLGTHLKEYLLALSGEESCQVLTLGRSDSLAEMTEKMTAFQPDVVFHLATVFVAEHTDDDLERLVDANLLFGLKVLQAMQKSGCRKLVNTGTHWQNWNGERGTPVSLYAATKNAFEELIRYFVSADDFQVLNLRLCDTYGEDDPRGKIIAKLIELSESGGAGSFSPGDQLIDLTHQSDVIRGLVHAAKMLIADQTEPGFMKVFVLSSGEKKSLREVAALVEELSGKKVDAGFGRRPYRRREVMVPLELDPILPGWSAEISLRDGIKRLLK